MFGRIFGRGKDDHDQAVCAECGRTLLAGEWTQTVIDERGDERLICSLCGQAYAGHHEPVAAAPTPANQGRVRETLSESRFDDSFDPAPAAVPPEPKPDSRAQSDAFWQALKDKDAHIEQLKAELARAEAERQELAGQFARLGTAGAAEAAPEPGSLTGDSSEPGERTWGETPAEFAAEMAALRESEAAAAPREIWDEPAAAFVAGPAFTEEPEPPAPVSPEPAAAEPAPVTGLAEPRSAADEPAGAGFAAAPEADETGDLAAPAPEADETGDLAAPMPEADQTGDLAAPMPEAEAPAAVPASVFEDTQPIDVLAVEMPEAGEDEAGTGEIAAVAAATAAVAADEPAVAEPQEPAPSAAEAEAAATSLTLLQRGADLLNVSRVPRKISETNEQLGLPHVHVGFDGETVAVTFMWTMGWYRFDVDLESGDVSMGDRGYDELVLQPNAGVRADGTVQLAPAQISRAAAQRAQAPAEPAPVTPEPAVVERETPREAAQKPPEFLSKSLLGQRSDDAPSSWDQTKARDFDWDR